MKISDPLTGERIVIRNYERDDLSFLRDMWFDEENGKYLSDPTGEYADERYRRVLDNLENSEDGYYLVAEPVGGGAPVASAGIFPMADGIYDIGYCVHKSHWRQGLGTEIVALLLTWLDAHGADRVRAEVAADNLPSNRLLRKFGFTVEKKSAFQKYNMNVRFESYLYEKELRPQTTVEDAAANHK